MTAVTVEEVQARLPELLNRLGPGEELIITRDRRPVARLQAITAPAPQPQLGSCKGMLTVLAEDDEHLKDFADYMP